MERTISLEMYQKLKKLEKEKRRCGDGFCLNRAKFCIMVMDRESKEIHTIKLCKKHAERVLRTGFLNAEIVSVKMI